jgi:hypothetical protein
MIDSNRKQIPVHTFIKIERPTLNMFANKTKVYIKFEFRL